ncbi:MAG: thioredoxin family protein [Opitutaceae bacterium]
MKKLLLAVILLALAVAAFVILRGDPTYADATDQFTAEELTSDGLVQVTVTASAKPYLVVYSTYANCPPGARFSPLLSEFYRTADRSKFQLIIKSYDDTEEQMIGDLKKYGFGCPVIPYTMTEKWTLPPTEVGVPNLVIIDTKTRRVVDERYHKGIFGLKNVGPEVPLETLRRIASR